MNIQPRTKKELGATTSGFLLGGISRTVPALVGLAIVLFALAACYDHSGFVATPPAPTPTIPTIADPQSTWAPPTALAGTPIPGAEATLTAAPRLKTGTLTIVNADGEDVNIHVEIADSQETRELGLMFRTSMAPDEGMLFDFGGESTGGFWMANTLLPLSIAFIAQDGTILNIEDMQPLDTNITAAAGPYYYALEANQGYFRTHNILPGGKALLPVVLDSAGGAGPAIPGMPDCTYTSLK